MATQINFKYTIQNIKFIEKVRKMEITCTVTLPLFQQRYPMQCESAPITLLHKTRDIIVPETKYFIAK